MSAFRRYSTPIDPSNMDSLNYMSSAEAASLGLPGGGQERLDLVERINALRVEKEKTRMGNPAKGFDFAISASRILTRQRAPRIFHTGNKDINIPLILHVENDKPLWEGFRIVFPTIAEAAGISMHVNSVDSARNIFDAVGSTPLASHEGMLLVAQSFQVALECEPEFVLWDTNPAQHILVTFEAQHSSINLSTLAE